MRIAGRARWFLRRGLIGAVPLIALFGATDQTRAGLLTAYVTGETPAADVVFRVTFDPAVAGSAVAVPVLSDTIRLDGIDFLPGSHSRVAVGAQAAGGGAITHYNVGAGTVLPAFVPDTNTVMPAPPASGLSRPSTVLATPGHIYYVENQFGFAGGTQRIMRTPIGGPPGAAAVVFDGSALGALGLRNFEGLEIVGDRLYFFAEDHLAPAFRALYSIKLDGAGLWDGAAPVQNLGHLTERAGSTDGSDELDFDSTTGLLYGTNMVSGEVIFYDPLAMTGGFLISPGAIASAPVGSSLARLGTAATDGIRATGDGFLVITGVAGVILSIDIAGVHLDGPDSGDVRILYDDAVVGAGYRFDDLTPLAAVPEPTTFAAGLTLIGLSVLARCRGFRRRSDAPPTAG